MKTSATVLPAMLSCHPFKWWGAGVAFSCWLLCGTALSAAAELEAQNDWFRAWPPAGVVYSGPSKIRQGATGLGEIDTLSFNVTFIESVELNSTFDLLLGLDWQRFQASVPAGISVPHTLQSAAAAAGFDWRIADPWRLRLEVLPGVYSDF
jgi:hypothetical protein